MRAWSRAVGAAPVNVAIKSLVPGPEQEIVDSLPLPGRRPESGYNDLANPPSGL